MGKKKNKAQEKIKLFKLSILFIFMDIVYTLHAKKQIEARKIQNVWVEETIKSPDTLDSSEHKFYAIKKLNAKTLKVIYVKEKYIKVITAFFIK